MRWRGIATPGLARNSASRSNSRRVRPDLPAGAAHLVGRGVERQVREAARRAGRTVARAAQQRPARGPPARPSRRASPGSRRRRPRDRRCGPRLVSRAVEHQDRHAGSPSPRRRRHTSRPSTSGQQQVEEQQVGRPGAQLGHGLRRVGGRRDLEALVRERPDQLARTRGSSLTTSSRPSMSPRVGDPAPGAEGARRRRVCCPAVKHTLSVLVENKPRSPLPRRRPVHPTRLQHRLPGRQPDGGPGPLAHDHHG